jgi:oxygen-independent coproporphyrinogen-3 oxidase
MLTNRVKTLLPEEVQRQLEKNLFRHQINKVLHGHPSPMYWKAPNEGVVLKKPEGTWKSRRVNFYIGIPYCIPTDPPHCGFCLFPTEKYTGKDAMNTYLDHLEMEATQYVDFYEGASLESIYVGGGTPNLLAPESYARLLEIARNIFPNMNDSIEKTLEGIPQLFNEAKVKAIRDAGFNRVSMGVQQMNDKLIKHSGRRQTRRQIFEAISLFHKYSLACNLDLIYGWPEQTVEDMLQDLRDAVDLGVRHITHYELNIGGRSDFSTARKDLVANVPTKIAMYQEAKNFLTESGYIRRTVYDWEKPEPNEKFSFAGAEKYSYENNLRELLKVEADSSITTNSMGAIGYAAINNHFGGPNTAEPATAMMNHKSLSKYYEDTENGRLPVERMFRLGLNDVKLTWIFQCSQEMKISKTQYRKIFDDCLYEEYRNIWSVLEERNWIRNTEEEIQFINEGEFYIPTIQALLSKARLEEISLASKLA